MKDTAVIGIGNILQRDDGMGVHVIKQLEKENVPSAVVLVDGGTSTINLLSYFMDYNKIIIIDCMKAGLEPGTIYRISPEDITSCKNENLSIHDVQILDVVRMVNQLGKFPQVVIFGIEPKEINLNLEMTALMVSRIPEVVKHIKRELEL